MVQERLAEDGRVFLQTDIEFLADEMFGLFRDDPYLIEIAINENPFPVQTERERAVEEKGLPVFRALFKKQVV